MKKYRVLYVEADTVHELTLPLDELLNDSDLEHCKVTNILPYSENGKQYAMVVVEWQDAT